MQFKKYQHIERIGTTGVDRLLFGECYVFYKIDGTNGTVYLHDGQVKAGSRNRELTLENDNAGFYTNILTQENIKNYLEKHPNHRLYGEWLVPHSLKTYSNDAWRKFYVFDVVVDDVETDSETYLHYEIYSKMLDKFNINYIPPIAVVKNPDYDQLTSLLDKTGDFLIREGKGEGIVVKNYNYKNRYGVQLWGKIVTDEFKGKHKKSPEATSEIDLIEKRIVDKYITIALVEKEYSKIINELGEWKNEYIPRLLNTVYYSLISEECWNFIKENKFPQINFKTLMLFSRDSVKSIKSELFS